MKHLVAAVCLACSFAPATGAITVPYYDAGVQTAEPIARPAILRTQSFARDDFSTAAPERAMATFGLMLGMIVLALYFIPAIIAFARRHAYRWPITALTVLGGWSGIGWLAALVWACWPRDGRLNVADLPESLREGAVRMTRGSSTVDLDKIERLAKLRDSEVISEDEFLKAKADILGRI